MPVEQREYLKRNLFSISTLVLLIGFIVQQSKWQQKTEDDIQLLRHEFIDHKSDSELHMTLKDKIDLFVPRVELEKDLQSIKDNMEMMDKNINDKLDGIDYYLKKNLN